MTRELQEMASGFGKMICKPAIDVLDFTAPRSVDAMKSNTLASTRLGKAMSSSNASIPSSSLTRSEMSKLRGKKINSSRLTINSFGTEPKKSPTQGVGSSFSWLMAQNTMRLECDRSSANDMSESQKQAQARNYGLAVGPALTSAISPANGTKANDALPSPKQYIKSTDSYALKMNMSSASTQLEVACSDDMIEMVLQEEESKTEMKNLLDEEETVFQKIALRLLFSPV